MAKGAREHESESGIGRLVAVFRRSGAAKRLKDRNEWIGWDSVTCAKRRKPLWPSILAEYTL